MAICDGILVSMNATRGIDMAGRIVVPKKVRDAVGLKVGDPLAFEVRGDEIVIRSKPKGKGLHKDRGLWVYDSGTALTEDDVNSWINDDRERRLRYVAGESLEP
jgi:AbrB family looped-hinge helix DNA binding protein